MERHTQILNSLRKAVGASLAALLCISAGVCLGGCDEARYSQAAVVVDSGIPDSGLPDVPAEPDAVPEPDPEPDVQEPDCPEAQCSDGVCLQQGGWRFTATTAEIPVSGGLMPIALKAFPAPSESPFAGIIASHATGAQGSPEQVRFWYVDKATESIAEGSGYTEPAGFPVYNTPGELELLVDMVPPEGNSAFGMHYFVVADNRDVDCDLQGVYMGVVESQPSTWPIMSVRLPEILGNVVSDFYLPGQRTACQIQSVALSPLANNTMSVALSIVFPDHNAAVLVTFGTTTGLELGRSELVGVLVGEEGAEVSLTDLSWGEHPLNLSGRWNSGSTQALVAYHDAGGNRAPDFLVFPIGESVSERAAEGLRLFENAMDFGASRFFVLEPQGTLRVHEIQGREASNLAELPGAGNRLWIHHNAPSGFDLIWGELLSAPGSGRYAIDLWRQALDEDTWQPLAVPEPLIRVINGSAQDQALQDGQVVIDDQGTASLFYRRLHFGEQTSAEAVFVYDLSPGCIAP